MKRKFSWVNFSKFLLILISCLIGLWLVWGVVDIDLHNEKNFDNPSKFNPYVILINLLEREVD